MELAEKYWFSSWFDTPYYHILYKDRNDDEARDFMKNLVSFLELPQGASILDLACGRGRHSVFLNSLGFDVTGVDLSENSIAYAKQFENETLQFDEHCMCKPVDEKFDAVFNLFTSLGYFDQEKDNLESIQAIREEIKEGGYGVIDFMNVTKVMENLVPAEVKTVKGIDFDIKRRVQDGYILKDIKFEDDGESYEYTEKVRALDLDKFREYFKKAGINLKHTFGNYNLDPFDEKTSDRLILVFN
ncbi:class I SAM-dependent methyltransferase [Salinimicrobium flavum]|uniref:Class I SAM-dependent methyltransferase n=1 Tax=Salinimicrobium flavum TaxID=1737065 RepID=A0ABW5J152_9FLAO